MKKFGKSLLVLVTLLVALVGVLTFAACDGKSGSVKGTKGKYTVQVLDEEGNAFTEVTIQVCAVDENGVQILCDSHFVAVNEKGIAVIDALMGPENSAYEGETFESVMPHLYSKTGTDLEGYTYEASPVSLGGVVTITVKAVA